MSNFTDGLTLGDDYILVLEDNQAIFHVAVKLTGADDPPVYFRYNEQGAVWVLLAETFSDWILATVWDSLCWQNCIDFNSMTDVETFLAKSTEQGPHTYFQNMWLRNPHFFRSVYNGERYIVLLKQSEFHLEQMINQPDMQILTDPSGTVYDITTGYQIPDVAVACMNVIDHDGRILYNLWDASSFGQANPQATGGSFQFMTPAGTYQLAASNTNYQTYRTWDIVVADEPVTRDIHMTPVISEAAAHQVTITDTGFSPEQLDVQPGEIVEWVNASGGEHTATSDDMMWDSGLLQVGGRYKFKMGETPGSYTYTDKVYPDRQSTIVIVGDTINGASLDAARPEQSHKVFMPFVAR
ncbi:MAG: cupredoxin domain-containing protein [Chloroflexota bacterium]